MLRVGLTGGIGAGKSTVARRLVGLGATLVDADQVAREVVLPGSVGLARLVERFGAEVLDSEGALDRPRLGDIVFGDPEARQQLNGILHPLIGQRTAELMAEAPRDSVIVQDVPLLVEGGMAASFPLVVVVHAPEAERIRRLVDDRGMTEEAARARIAAQADDEARRAVADVWLDNSGSADAVRTAVDRLWTDRLRPFDAALRGELQPACDPVEPVDPDPSWSQQYERLAARVARAVGAAAVRLDHVGPTSVPGLAARDVIDVQLAVQSLDEVPKFASDLASVGFLSSPREWSAASAHGRTFTSADPGRPAHVHVREVGSAGYRDALLVRDWMRSEPNAAANHAASRRPALPSGNADRTEYAHVEDGWCMGSLDPAARWAERTGWRVPTAAAQG
jgi:dephospho-CoA kinase